MLFAPPEHCEAPFSPRSTAPHSAIALLVSDESTPGQAAEAAGLSQAQFLREFGKRRIPLHYGGDELAADLPAVEALAGK